MASHFFSWIIYCCYLQFIGYYLAVHFQTIFNKVVSRYMSIGCEMNYPTNSYSTGRRSALILRVACALSCHPITEFPGGKSHLIGWTYCVVHVHPRTLWLLAGHCPCLSLLTSSGSGHWELVPVVPFISPVCLNIIPLDDFGVFLPADDSFLTDFSK